jgi:circadian clock protein KaiC
MRHSRSSSAKVQSLRSSAAGVLKKAPAGITGFDELTGGGLPHGRTTLVVGGPGSGKTIFALQFLIHGARHCHEPGVCVAFEEEPERIVHNMHSFGWKADALIPGRLQFMDAQPTADLVQNGDFDLGGMLAVLGAQAKAMGARRIVFDALDVVLSMLADANMRRREVYRLHEWLAASGYTAIITSKAESDAPSGLGPQANSFMQFMVDCCVILNHRVAVGVSQRNLRVQKYRGSAFDESESPFVIGKNGIEVANIRAPDHVNTPVTLERVSSGVKRLDNMLGGGYYRAASVLITGYPGTAKTTLSGAFAESACERGERTVFVSFDSDGGEVIRNLTSVGIQLKRFVKTGILRVIAARSITGSAETLLVHVKMIAGEHRARCLVIDPVSALSKSGNELTAHGVAERLIDWSKGNGITLVCTSLLDDSANNLNGSTPLQISTLADTWIHLNYLVQAGERNRGMSIVKSRGTHHSNQVRELILSKSGVTLADIYTASGDVLMGTMRWEKETADQQAVEVATVEGKLKRLRLSAEESEYRVRLKAIETELAAKQVEKLLLTRSLAAQDGQESRRRTRIRELRSADPINRKGK